MLFPVPTDYTYEQSLDLNTLIKNAPVRFFFPSRWGSDGSSLYS